MTRRDLVEMVLMVPLAIVFLAGFVVLWAWVVTALIPIPD